MKSLVKPHETRAAFTIVELLTVMSIIVILIGLLVPALNNVKRYALTVKQNAQFHSVNVALGLFHYDFEEYPDSSAMDDVGDEYYGAIKLCEAMMGQDLMGFHPRSRFRLSDTQAGNTGLYRYVPGTSAYLKNLEARKDVYLSTDKVNARRISDIYPAEKLSSAPVPGLTQEAFVLCDVYRKVNDLGDTGGPRIGMPVLYYKADELGQQINPAGPPTKAANNGYIYNSNDNMELVELGMPWDITSKHVLLGNFYEFIRNVQISDSTGASRPSRSDSYILISAGWDGEYGTRDDIANFPK